MIDRNSLSVLALEAISRATDGIGPLLRLHEHLGQIDADHAEAEDRDPAQKPDRHDEGRPTGYSHAAVKGRPHEVRSIPERDENDRPTEVKDVNQRPVAE